MKRSRVVLLVSAAVAAVGLLLFGVGASWGRDHVREVTGGHSEGVMCTNCHAADSPQARYQASSHPAPWALVQGPDPRTLYAACAPARSLAVIDLAEGRTRRFLPVEGQPRGLALSPDGRTLAVTLKDRARVAFVNTATNRVERTAEVGRGPAGVAWNEDGTLLFVANAEEGSVSVLAWPGGREVRRAPAGREPFTVTRSPQGGRIAVVSRRAGIDRPEKMPRSQVSIFDAQDGRPLRSLQLDSCHMSEGAAFTPDGSRLLVPAILVRNRLPILQVARGWVMSSVMAVIDVEQGQVSFVPLTEVQEGFPDPCGVDVSPDGKHAYVAIGGGDEVAVIDLPELLAVASQTGADLEQALSLSARYLKRRTKVGPNPRGVLTLVDQPSARVAISERLGDSIVLLEGEGHVETRILLGPRVEEDPTHHGEQLFHSADFAFQRAFSCRSCHPDGHTDGLVYDFEIDGVGRNPLLNRSLHGIAGTGPFKWSGKNPTIERQCGARFAMVLTRADPLEGQDLQDLVSFIHSLRPPPPNPGATLIGGTDTGAAERGRLLFERSTRKDGTPIPASGRCVTCHPPPLYTNRMRSDVGTKGPLDSSGLFDVPHLTGAGSKAPYMHDGRALTLEEIWTAEGVGDLHGVVTDLNKADLNDLVVFMKGL